MNKFIKKLMAHTIASQQRWHRNMEDKRVSRSVCSKCQKEPNEGWPGNTGNPEELLCQMCWEAQCDESWWDMVEALNKAGLLGE